MQRRHGLQCFVDNGTPNSSYT